MVAHNVFSKIFDKESRHLFYIAISLFILAVAIDVAGYFNYCINDLCENSSWAIGTSLSAGTFIAPALIIHFYFPNRIKGKFLAIPVCILFWGIWVVERAFITNGEEFRPNLISIVGLIIFYKFTSIKKFPDGGG